jgi:rare lipoprotein A
VEVEINDRGPFAENRIIDLSHAAAKALEMKESGTATVRLELSSGP